MSNTVDMNLNEFMQFAKRIQLSKEDIKQLNENAIRNSDFSKNGRPSYRVESSKNRKVARSKMLKSKK